MPSKPIETLKDAFSIEGKNVIVTGGNRGIGYGISRAYAEAGANVAILSRNAESGKAAVETLRPNGGNYLFVQCDTGSFDNVKSAVAEVIKEFGTIDVLVNNAGIAPKTMPFLEDKELIEWERVINTNLNGFAYMISQVGPNMVENGSGLIVNISSIGGTSLGGAKFHPKASYHVTKAAVDMFTKAEALELGDFGVRVVGIAPGPTHSDLDKQLPPEAFAHIEGDMPMHRFGEPIEIGALCVFLTSPAASQITGIVIAHDGGMLLV